MSLEPEAESLSIPLDPSSSVSGLWMTPAKPLACLVLAHGAGAGMRHPFLSAVAAGLAKRGIATLRYQFPYMERGSKRTDPPPLCHATVRAAVNAASSRTDAPLFAGGRSFGGRMTSQAQGVEALSGVRGLAFLGFPLHPAKKPGMDRTAHLEKVRLPMLFLQGTRDELAEFTLIEQLIARLGERASLKVFEGADHSFHVLARSGRKDVDVLEELIATLASWMSAKRAA